MSKNFFIEDRDNIIENFEINCVRCNALEKIGDFTDDDIDEIVERFNEHKNCYNNDGADAFENVIYGDNINAAIECKVCNSIIIDSDVIKGDE